MTGHFATLAASGSLALTALGSASLSIPRFGVFRRTRLKSPEPPIRAELFSIERLEQHAAAQHVAPNLRRSRPLAKRLYDNTKVLTEAYHTVARASSAHQPITPAAEWLLDNFHILDEQIREIKDDLPPGFYRRLPKLADGPLTAIRVCSASLGRSSPTRTARSTRKGSLASSGLTSGSNP